MTRIRAGYPDRSLAGRARERRYEELRKVRSGLGITPAGEALMSAAAASDQRTELGLGDAAVEDASAFAAAGHNHDASYSALGHNHTGTYAPLSHTHDGTQVSLNADNWVGSLAGSGVKDCQDLADWIDANVVGG